MLITRENERPEELAPGWRASRLATQPHDGRAFELWRCALDAGAASPWALSQAHDVLIVLAGHGKARLPDGPVRFVAPCSLALPPRTEYQLVNLGAQELQWIAVSTSEPRVPPSAL
jgi:mannose-6-phosphate isomerase-like protein (cupin superfamily)